MKEFSTIKTMIKQMSFILTNKQKKQMIGMFFVIFVGAIFDLLGVTLMLPFIQSIMAPEELLANKYVFLMAEYLNVKDSNSLILMVGLFLIGIYLIKNTYLLFSSYLQASYSANTQRELAVSMLESYTLRPYSFFVDNNSGDLLRGVTSDVARIYNVIRDFFKLLSESLVVIAIVVYLFTVDVLMTVSIMFIGVACFTLIVTVLKKRITQLGVVNREVDAKTTMCALQTVSGIKDVFVFNKRNYFIDEYDKSYVEKCKIETKYVFFNAAPERIIEAFCISGILAVVIIKVETGVNVDTFVPRLAVFAVSAFRMLPSIARITGYISSFMFARSTIEAAYNDILSSREYMSKVSNESIDTNLTDSLIFENEICVNAIDWTYENSDKKTLNNCSVTIKKGESVGLIGESGAGKSTLADILLALYRPQRGTITMDGVDIFSIPNTWTSCVSYVPQSVFMLDDSIAANVAFGEKSVDENRLWEALEKANIAAFVRNLPEGINTIIGERGVKFSGGQRQRLAIARAIYRKPQILILDEATSALDNETENAVMDAINALQGSITMIIIAHRLTTIANCDKIYEIKSGTAVLVEKDSIF